MIAKTANRSRGVVVPTKSVCLFGTPGSHLNLGVGALRDSTVHAVQQRLPEADLTIFDDGWGVRDSTAPGGRVTLCGARNSRRWHRPESFVRMRASVPLRGWGNPGTRRVIESSLVLDVSGGDSFSDIYGHERFETVAWPKRVALAARRPLVLLPQTYGPFVDGSIRARAADLLRGATQVWARDMSSKATADELIGADKARLGVDMAFGLPTATPDAEIADAWHAWSALEDGPIAGININGMLVNQQDSDRRFGVGPGHDEQMVDAARRILRSSDWRVALVPHVLGEGAVDSDVAVCRRAAGVLRAEFGKERVFLADGYRRAGETKWVISQLSWFSGARMHATIAALSSGVPTAGVAYSRKMGPVFEQLGQPTADARALRDDSLVDVLLEHWQNHASARVALAERLPAVLETWSRQVDAICSVADGPAAS